MASRRRAKIKARKRAERAVGTMPGVPSFQGGTDGGLLTGPATGPVIGGGLGPINLPAQLQGATGPGFFREVGPEGPTRIRDMGFGTGILEVWNPMTGRYEATSELINLPDAGGGGGGGAAAGPPQFRPGELELLQEQNNLERRQQDLTVEQENLNRQQRELESQRQFQIARGQLQLARQTERRIGEIQRAQQALAVRAQGLEEQRFALEEEATRFGLQISKAAQQGQLATAQGNIAARRAEFLSGLLANPRDFVQSQIALGGGQSFIQSLLQGQQVGGQSTGLIGDTPTLGQGFANALAQINARPEQDLFQQASETLGQIPSQFGPLQQQQAQLRTDPEGVKAAVRLRLQNDPAFRQQFQQRMRARQASMRGALKERAGVDPNFARRFAGNAGLPGFAGGGRMVLDEPVVAIGQVSGRPRFTAGEGGEPEIIDITPLNKVRSFQEGGRVTFGGLQQTGTPQQPRTKTASALGATAAKNLFTRRQTAQQPQQRAGGGAGMTVNVSGGGVFNAAPPPFPEDRPSVGDFGDPIGDRGDLPIGGDLVPPGGVIAPPPNLPPPPLDLSSLTGPGDFFGGTVTPPAAFQNVPTGLMGLAQFLLGDQFQQTFPNRPEITPEMVEFIQRGIELSPRFRQRFVRDVQEQRLREQSAFNQLPQTPGEAARLLSTFSPRQFFNLLPEQEQLRQSLLSGIAVDPASNVDTILRQIPTAPNPGSVAFGNFREGGRVTVAPYR
ncbi:hypothetical protein LCGC14_0445170 [marine sediment metagenome]|uniref:Uncharacterized protein n=1 Tax=marine sediment metagenome TaxID=412755 RepID=A0A0F9SJA8_9ZZZZ